MLYFLARCNVRVPNIKVHTYFQPSPLINLPLLHSTAKLCFGVLSSFIIAFLFFTFSLGFGDLYFFLYHRCFLYHLYLLYSHNSHDEYLQILSEVFLVDFLFLFVPMVLATRFTRGVVLPFVTLPSFIFILNRLHSSCSNFSLICSICFSLILIAGLGNFLTSVTYTLTDKCFL